MKRRALVLAGGGYVASSWETGLIAGLADAGVDLRNADLFVGTSAGARVALDLTSGRTLEELYQRRVSPKLPPLERLASIDVAWLRDWVAAAKQRGGSPSEILRSYGELARRTAPVEASSRHDSVATELSVQTWPEQSILITAVNAETGNRRAFDRTSGIDLVDAVIATTASFGTAPLLYEGHHYIDGGYYSSDNADLAIGYERVLIIALRSPREALRLIPVEAGIDILRGSGSLVEVIHPDEDTLAAMAPTGGQMNPASGRPAALAGRAHGRRVGAERVGTFWQ